MSAAEFAFWGAYFRKRGFPVDRLEGATAIAGAAVVRSWGGKVDPADLLPRFGPRVTDLAVLAAQLSALPGAKVEYVPRPERAAARAKLLATRPSEPAPKSRLLNPGA